MYEDFKSNIERLVSRGTSLSSSAKDLIELSIEDAIDDIEDDLNLPYMLQSVVFKDTTYENAIVENDILDLTGINDIFEIVVPKRRFKALKQIVRITQNGNMVHNVTNFSNDELQYSEIEGNLVQFNFDIRENFDLGIEFFAKSDFSLIKDPAYDSPILTSYENLVIAKTLEIYFLRKEDLEQSIKYASHYETEKIIISNNNVASKIIVDFGLRNKQLVFIQISGDDSVDNIITTLDDLKNRVAEIEKLVPTQVLINEADITKLEKEFEQTAILLQSTDYPQLELNNALALTLTNQIVQINGESSTLEVTMSNDNASLLPSVSDITLGRYIIELRKGSQEVEELEKNALIGHFLPTSVFTTTDTSFTRVGFTGRVLPADIGATSINTGSPAEGIISAQSVYFNVLKIIPTQKDTFTQIADASFEELQLIYDKILPLAAQSITSRFTESPHLSQVDTFTSFNQVLHYPNEVTDTVEFTIGNSVYANLGYTTILDRTNFALRSTIVDDVTSEPNYFKIHIAEISDILNPDAADNLWYRKITLQGKSFSVERYPDKFHTGVYNDPNVANSFVSFQLVTLGLIEDGIDGAELKKLSVPSSALPDNIIQKRHVGPNTVDNLALINDSVSGGKIQDDAIDTEHVSKGAITKEKLSDALQQDAENVELNSAVGMFNNSRFEYLSSGIPVNVWSDTPSDGGQLAPEIFMMNIGATPLVHSPFTPAHLQHRIGRHISGFTGSRHYFTIAKTDWTEENLATPSFTADGVVGFKRRITANELNESLFGTTLAGDLTLKMSYYNNNPSGVIGIKLKDYRNRKALWRVIPMNTPDLEANMYHTITEIIEPHQIVSGQYGAQEGDVTSLELMIAIHGQGRYTNQWTGQITNDDGVLETVTQDVPPSWHDEEPDVNEFYSLSPHFQTTNQFYTTRLDMGRGRDVTRINDKSSDLQRRGIEERNKRITWGKPGLRGAIGVTGVHGIAVVRFGKMLRKPTAVTTGTVRVHSSLDEGTPLAYYTETDSIVIDYQGTSYNGGLMTSDDGFILDLDASKQPFVA